MRRTIITSAALAVTLAMPVAAQQQNQSQTPRQQNQPQAAQQQTQQQTQRQGAQATSGAQQPMSEQARACVDQLVQIDQDLAEVGYGRAGPGGYGVPSAAAPPRSTAAQRAGAVSPFGGASTPRADMQVLMRAGYVLAVNGYDRGCQQVAQAAQDIGKRYDEAIRTGGVDPDSMREWRGQFLSSAVLVSELDQPMRAEEIIGADLRNLRDEDLGDIEDVVFGANGEAQYVIVYTGGFLGLGEDWTPVPWQDLRVTAQPYRDTFVLDVTEEAFDNAPRLEGMDPVQLVSGDGAPNVDRYWRDAGQAR